MDTTKKQATSKAGVAGKKRKKKKPSKDAGAAIIPSKDKVKSSQELATSKRADLAAVLTVHKLEERCSSSSSSVENHRPKEKMGRFDGSSSDMMSRDSASTTSQRERMLVDSDSHTSQVPTPITQSHQLSIGIDPTSQPQQLSLASKRNGCVRVITPQTEESWTLPDKPLALRESLRWEGALSDEEEESARIEQYKVHRRKRYQEALMQKKEHIYRNTSKKQLYYTSPATLTAVT